MAQEGLHGLVRVRVRRDWRRDTAEPAGPRERDVRGRRHAKHADLRAVVLPTRSPQAVTCTFLHSAAPGPPEVPRRAARHRNSVTAVGVGLRPSHRNGPQSALVTAGSEASAPGAALSAGLQGLLGKTFRKGRCLRGPLPGRVCGFAAASVFTALLPPLPVPSAFHSRARAFLRRALPRPPCAVRPGEQGCLALCMSRALATSSHRWTLKRPPLKDVPGTEFLSLGTAGIRGRVILSHQGGVLRRTLRGTEQHPDIPPPPPGAGSPPRPHRASLDTAMCSWAKAQSPREGDQGSSQRSL